MLVEDGSRCRIVQQRAQICVRGGVVSTGLRSRLTRGLRPGLSGSIGFYLALQEDEKNLRTGEIAGTSPCSLATWVNCTLLTARTLLAMA
jgi:hypothetical protein